jgi:hypothetical protein
MTLVQHHVQVHLSGDIVEICNRHQVHILAATIPKPRTMLAVLGLNRDAERGKHHPQPLARQLVVEPGKRIGRSAVSAQKLKLPRAFDVSNWKSKTAMCSESREAVERRHRSNGRNRVVGASPGAVSSSSV